jgi:general secretion pathway protein G
MFRTKRPNEGFTLIELLVVIAIIAILAALVLNTAGYIQKKGARSRAASEIAALSTALESYKVEYGDYPTASGAIVGNGIALYSALVISNSSNNPSGKVFFEPYKGICFNTSYSTPGNYFVDPFGQPYQYSYPGAANKSGTNFFDLFSYGGSTKTNMADTNHWETWVKNW